MKQKVSVGDMVFDIFNFMLMLFLMLAFVLPFIFIINGSLISDTEYARTGGVVLLPQTLSGATYRFLIKDGEIVTAFVTSVLRLLVAVPLQMLLTIILAYALTQRNMPGYKALVLFVIVMMFFDGGLIPTFFLIRDLGLYNNLWVYILPSLISVYNALLLRNFMNTIPESLSESAKLDGASEYCIVTRIILPLSIPGIATISLFFAVSLWNDWFTGMIYIKQGTPQPLQTYLRKILDLSSLDLNEMGRVLDDVAPLPEPLKMAAIVITTVPILLVYPFIQRYFVSGIVIGAVKG